MNIAILLSGGVGSRIHSNIPKQYISVSNRLIITYALETLVNCSLIDWVYIVADSEWKNRILDNAAENHIPLGKVVEFVEPGQNRQESVWNGLQTICMRNKGILEADSIQEESIVLIHDAARPLLTVEQIEACFEALKNYDGVMPVLPMKDTVYLSEDGLEVSKLLERQKIFAGQSPELFRFEKYYLANQKLLPEKIKDINGSTEPAILADMRIAMVPGDENNYKITTDTDLKRFIQSRI